MSRFLYPTDALAAFDAMEVDAMLLEHLAEDMEQSAAVIRQLENGSPDVVKSLTIRAKRLRRIAACLGYMAGRVDRLHLLNEPGRRESNYGGNQWSAA